MSVSNESNNWAEQVRSDYLLNTKNSKRIYRWNLLLLILQYFDWLAAFHLEFLQANRWNIIAKTLEHSNCQLNAKCTTLPLYRMALLYRVTAHNAAAYEGNEERPFIFTVLCK
jgi:hypothetical protein